MSEVSSYAEVANFTQSFRSPSLKFYGGWGSKRAKCDLNLASEAL